MIPTFVQDRKGNTYLNPSNAFVKGLMFTPQTGQNSFSLADPATLAAPTRSAPIILEGPENAFSEIYSIIGQVASPSAERAMNCGMTIYDTSNRRNLMNRPVPFPHILGNNVNPFFMPESLFLRGQQTLQVTLFNQFAAGGGSQTGQFAFEGTTYQRGCWGDAKVVEYLKDSERRKLFLSPYWLTLDDGFIALTASATRDIFLTINASLCFLVTSIMASGSTAGVAGNTVDKFTLEFFDPKTERPLQNQPILRTSAGGDSFYPYVLPTPWLLDADSKLHVRAVNLVTDASTNVYLTLSGVACFMGAVPR